jgi:hypothetical protein
MIDHRCRCALRNLFVVVLLTVMASATVQARVQRDAVPSTIDVMTQLVSTWADARAAADAIHTLDVADHPEKSWFEASMIAAMQARGITVTRGIQGNRHRIVILDASTRYELADHADSVVRIVTLRLYEESIGADGSSVTIAPLDSVNTRRTDILSRDNVAAAQSMQYSSMRGDVPPPPRNLWDDLLEPVVYVAAAAVTVVLLFTVRSR